MTGDIGWKADLGVFMWILVNVLGVMLVVFLALAIASSGKGGDIKSGGKSLESDAKTRGAATVKR